MKKFIIKTHGCKTNQLESAVIAEKLREQNFEEVQKIQDAQIYILNSCSVTSNSDDEALRHLRHVKNSNPNILTILTGCVAQIDSENLKNIDYIDILAGNNDKFEIVDILSNKKNKVTDIFEINNFNNQPIYHYQKTRGYLKIQDGCNNYCSYCTIPLGRGRSRSNSIKNIIEQIKIYTDIGIKEVVLTGIHIGQWGEDIHDKFKHLLEEIEKTEIQRYRLGSLNPLELDDELIDFLCESDKFCPHFHLSLQSLNDKTLADMNRHYGADKCIELINKLNQKFNLPFLGSDIIVGFPDETEEDFEITLNNARKAGLSNIHVFPYSVRKNTKAAAMENQVSLKSKKIRAQKLKEVAAGKYCEFINKNVNTVQEILIEKHPDRSTGLLKGVTKNYLNVIVVSNDYSLTNTIQKVRIVKFEDDKLFCNII